MKLRHFPIPMVAALVLFTSQSLMAAPFFSRSNPNTVHAAKVHTVNFSVRNDTPEDMTFKAADQSFTLQAGKTLVMKLPVGTTLSAQSSTPHYASGDLLTMVGVNLQGNTVVFN